MVGPRPRAVMVGPRTRELLRPPLIRRTVVTEGDYRASYVHELQLRVAQGERLHARMLLGNFTASFTQL
jgi:hypothetical protein